MTTMNRATVASTPHRNEEQRRAAVEQLVSALRSILELGLSDFPRDVEIAIRKKIAGGERVEFSVVLDPLKLVCTLLDVECAQPRALFWIDTEPAGIENAPTRLN